MTKIPTEVIRLAIAGGWAHPAFKEGSEWKVNHGWIVVKTPWPSDKFPDRKHRQKVALSGVALDREFWAGLGKSLGWRPNQPQYKHTFESDMPKDNCVNCRAMEFLHLVITGQDPTEFWASLIKDN